MKLGRPIENLHGQTFGRLTTLSLHGKDKWNRAQWLCLCTCGKQTVATSTRLKRGLTRSCGCLRDEENVSRNTSHGHSAKPTPEYITWQSMKDRVLNPNHVAYHCYGGLGVTICERWYKFENFLADMGLRPEGKTLDREDPSGNYEPNNCRWATPKEQANNRRKKI